MLGKSKFFKLFAISVGGLLLASAGTFAQSRHSSTTAIDRGEPFSKAIRDLVAWPQGRISPTVSGRVMASNDQNAMAIIGATVYLTDGYGFIRTTRTNWFGFYRFLSVAGDSCVVHVEHKRFRFEAQFVWLEADVVGLNFVPQP